MNNKFSLRDENGKIYFGYYILFMSALLGALVYNGIISTVGIFLVPVTTDLGILVSSFSLYVSILSITNIIVLFLFSKIVNKNNLKRIMLIAGALGVLSFVGFSFATEVWHFYIFAILQAICFSSCTSTPSMIMVSNWFGPSIRGRAMSIYAAGISVIYMFTMNVINMIVVDFGWRTGYLFNAGAILICLPIIYKFAVWSPEEKGISRMGEGDDPKENTLNSASLKGYTVKEGLKKAPVLMVLVSCVFLVLASSSMLSHQIPTLIMAGISSTLATFASSIKTFGLIFTTIFIGWCCDKVGVRFGATFTGLMFAASAFAYAMVIDAPNLMYVALFCYAFGIPAVNTVSPLVLAHVCGEKELYKFISYLNMLIAFGGIFGAPLVGAIFDITGGYKLAWLIMTVALVIAAFLRFIATSKKNKYA